MIEVFVDTSGFYAFIDGSDPRHGDAKRIFKRSLDEGWTLVTTSYVVHECWALMQHRLGWEAVDAWASQIIPCCQIVWVDERLHEMGVERARQSRERGFSLTDAVSLACIRQRGIPFAVAFDRHFEREGIRRP